jgi:pyruvate,water dikinase
MKDSTEQTVWFDDLGRGDVARVGGKNAALGEMIRSLAAAGVNVPPGFATTAAAYRRFIEVNYLEQEMRDALSELRDGKASLAEAGARIRRAVLRGDWPAETVAAIREGYLQLSRRLGVEATDVAVRSSATAEDLPEASFAGQQESFLNIRGADALLEACRRCYASLFTDRAIAYRQAQGFNHLEVALSIGIQKMVRSDLAGAGVMFSIDTETGFDRIVLIDAAWGLGEIVVQGAVDPDEYQVFKPLLDEPGVTPIVEKKRGEKARKVIYATDGGPPIREVSTSLAERGAWVLSDSEILQLARLGPGDRGALRDSRDPHAGDAEPRESRRGTALVASARRRRRARPHGVRHQFAHQGAPDGAGALRDARGPGGQARHRGADTRLRG